MQSLFYLLEEAEAHRRAGRLNLALKKYAAIQKVRQNSELPGDKMDVTFFCRSLTILKTTNTTFTAIRCASLPSTSTSSEFSFISLVASSR